MTDAPERIYCRIDTDLTDTGEFLGTCWRDDDGLSIPYNRADAIAVTQSVGVPVAPGQIERIMWNAMVWAANARAGRPGDPIPEYTDQGNSNAEVECRAVAARILAAIHVQPAPDVAQVRAEALREVADLVQRIAKGYQDGGDAAIACGLFLTEGNIRALITTPAPRPDVAALVGQARGFDAILRNHPDMPACELRLLGTSDTFEIGEAVNDMLDLLGEMSAALAQKGGVARINWRDDPKAVVEDDNPQIGRDYE